MMGLRGMKTPPREAVRQEQAIRVKTRIARPLDVPVHIQGYGEVRTLNTVTIAPEVAGRIVAVHPRLEVGEVVRKGALLFAVDPVNYQAALDQATAGVGQREKTIARLKEELKQDRLRFDTLKRNQELARLEFDRVKVLLNKNRVGTRSGVDKSEQAFNSARDQVDQMRRMLAVYPLRIQENQSALSAARAALDLARANLARCRITAPFTGRLKSVSVEAGGYAAPGMNALTLADDAVLEIHVPLDSRDVKNWLLFDTNAVDAADSGAWFSSVRPVDVRIHWTENLEATPWIGRLHRAVDFDPVTRTVTVAVRVSARDALPRGGMPLVEGMFCTVSIPGKMLEKVVTLPRWAVTFENTVYVAREGRLKTLSVEVARTQGENAYISKGIPPGEAVIVTRLVDPLENSLLDIVLPEDDA